jgi:hypothetical protein
MVAADMAITRRPPLLLCCPAALDIEPLAV